MPPFRDFSRRKFIAGSFDLATSKKRLLDPAGFKGKGRGVPGGAASILFLPLDPRKNLAALKVEASLHEIVVALLAVTLVGQVPDLPCAGFPPPHSSRSADTGSILVARRAGR
jgi:hypothetical protein